MECALGGASQRRERQCAVVRAECGKNPEGAIKRRLAPTGLAAMCGWRP